MTRSNLDCREDQVDTWDSLPSAATNSGRVISVTGIAAYPIKFVSNGTEWVPEGGQATLALSGVGMGIMPSGTISTGSSGHFVSGTALPHTYSEGLWMYIVSPSTTPALTAGFYWCVFSTTAICTIYQNGAGSSAYNFTVGAATTGSTSEITMRTVSIPGGLMGNYGQLVWDMSYSQLGSTTRTMKLKLGGSTCLSYGNSSGTNYNITNNGTISNATANVQYSKSGIGAILNTAVIRTTADTTANLDFVMTMQLGSATETMISHHLRLDLYK